MLKTNERLDQLIKENIRIIQNDDVFSFSTDALLLAHFVKPVKKGQVMDLCTGNGIIPLLLSDKSVIPIEGIEIQSQLVDMAKRSVEYNELSHQITITEKDLRTVTQSYKPSQYDIVTCNPPYFRENQSFQHLKEAHRIARHEIMCTLDDCTAASRHLLKQGGKLYMVHRADRLVDCLVSMRTHGIEPKTIWPIYSRPDKPNAVTVVIEAIKGGKSDCKVMPPFYIYAADGTYSSEMHEVYYG
ncbi:tRNA1(Val) (adenine(37)-N6)-methyltransferase [Macrococcus hajekii]|uniref:tRNA1(Val) (Adenine(37)-N6)-methyltransferase n=1 Tax=Macrococcus hajekii TaxID=198482 RepID=A0A4R6BHX7_9STAP|nr:tRNA1(Val) (adenine(37)-N6)-methyltransferase [Macrococcus hajekii]TDM01054.1 tRNA1(Val) (adenine(37)-N6)-methyltransferase [Macrococcus hajekii]GGB12768.1 O-methyltransferase [Macrococcus hajekii]